LSKVIDSRAGTTVSDSIVSSGELKNFWQIGKSGGMESKDPRRKAEIRLGYDDTAPSTEEESRARPMYAGLVPLDLLPSGTQGYGPSSIVFKESAKASAIATPKDSLDAAFLVDGGNPVTMANDPEALVANTNRVMLKAIVALATGDKANLDITDGHGLLTTRYIEAQIAGPVDLSMIKRLDVRERLSKDQIDRLHQLGVEHGFEVRVHVRPEGAKGEAWSVTRLGKPEMTAMESDAQLRSALSEGHVVDEAELPLLQAFSKARGVEIDVATVRKELDVEMSGGMRNLREKGATMPFEAMSDAHHRHWMHEVQVLAFQQGVNIDVFVPGWMADSPKAATHAFSFGRPSDPTVTLAFMPQSGRFVALRKKEAAQRQTSYPIEHNVLDVAKPHEQREDQYPVARATARNDAEL